MTEELRILTRISDNTKEVPSVDNFNAILKGEKPKTEIIKCQGLGELKCDGLTIVKKVEGYKNCYEVDYDEELIGVDFDKVSGLKQGDLKALYRGTVKSAYGNYKGYAVECFYDKDTGIEQVFATYKLVMYFA